MGTKIVALFNLKPGVSASDYETWARNTDLPTVNGLASVNGFEVLKSTGLLGTESPPPFAYIEIIDVGDMDRFGQDVASETMQKVASEFQSMTDDLVFIMTERVG